LAGRVRSLEIAVELFERNPLGKDALRGGAG
jgi:hypothetical protein